MTVMDDELASTFIIVNKLSCKNEDEAYKALKENEMKLNSIQIKSDMI